MATESFFHSAEFCTIKGAQRDLIKAAGGIDRCAMLTGLSTGHIGRFNNPDTPDIMSMPIAIRLEADIRRPVVSRAMVLIAGGTVEMAATDGGNASLMASSSEMMTENAEFYAAYAKAAGDGKFTTTELRSMRPKAEDARRAVDHVLASIDRQIAASLKSVEA